LYSNGDRDRTLPPHHFPAEGIELQNWITIGGLIKPDARAIAPAFANHLDFIFADAISRKIMVPVLKDFLIRATQHVDNVIHPKSFFATRHTREKLHRFNRPVFHGFGETVVTLQLPANRSPQSSPVELCDGSLSST